MKTLTKQAAEKQLADVNKKLAQCEKEKAARLQERERARKEIEDVISNLELPHNEVQGKVQELEKQIATIDAKASEIEEKERLLNQRAADFALFLHGCEYKAKTERFNDIQRELFNGLTKYNNLVSEANEILVEMQELEKTRPSVPRDIRLPQGCWISIPGQLPNAFASRFDFRKRIEPLRILNRTYYEKERS